MVETALAKEGNHVIVIAPSKDLHPEKLRVAAYARVSTDSDDQLNSFMAQTNYYTNLIASKEHWTLVDIYADEGITGTSAKKRPDFQRLLADCRKGRIDKILVKSISRFARNTRECLELVRELKSIGIGVCFEEQNIDTSQMTRELLTSVFAALAQKESESISGNMRWSYQHRMRSGKFITCKAPFGYRLKNGKLEIYEPEAQIVRLIFERYLTGQSHDEIAAEVTSLGVPTRDGKLQWQHTTIAYILRNERYVGDSLLQKRYTTDSLPFHEKRNHGEHAQYFRPLSHPPIIDRDTFAVANTLLDQRARKICVTKQPAVFSRKIVCGCCGTAFRKKPIRGITYWACQKYYRGKSNCPAYQITEREIHTAFLRLYHKLKFHGEPILIQLLSDLQAVRERRMLWSVDVIELNKKISDISDQNHMLAEMNKLGLVDSDFFISQSNDLANQLRAAKQEKEKLIEAAHDESIPATQELLETLTELPDTLSAFDDDIFDALIDRIVVQDQNRLQFLLKNGVILTESIERAIR